MDYVEITVFLDDILNKMTGKEKEDLYCELREELDKEQKSSEKEKAEITEHLRGMAPYEIRKILCNTLGVGSYVDDDALREALEPVIAAR